MKTVRDALLLALFAALSAAILAFVHHKTKDRTAFNERAYLLRSLNSVLAPDEYDNDLSSDIIQVSDLEHLGSDEPLTVYRARRDGLPVAAIISSTAVGYSGPIQLIVGVYYDGTLSGVRVVSHRETPGLGDKIEADRSDWILDFTGRSLEASTGEDWEIRQDGGVFDQFTGASITPRSVVKSVHNTLLYFAANRSDIFERRQSDNNTD